MWLDSTCCLLLSLQLTKVLNLAVIVVAAEEATEALWLWRSTMRLVPMTCSIIMRMSSSTVSMKAVRGHDETLSMTFSMMTMIV